MWIAINSLQSACAQALGCSTRDLQPDSDTWAATCEQFSSLNGKLTQRASWQRACKKAAYIQRLFGSAISPNSQQQSFEDWWIASLQASHAKTLAWPDGALGLTASGQASSSTSSTLPKLAVRDASFWRTSQASLLPPPPLWTKPKALSTNARPPASWENWPTAGGMRSGSLFQRPTWAPAMAARGGSAGLGEWLTPNVPNGGRSVSPELVASKGMTKDGQKRTIDLSSQTRHWATPTSNEHTGAGHSNSKQGASNLRTQVDVWTTPSASDGTRGGTITEAMSGTSLTQQVNSLGMWPTPKGTDGTKGGPNQAGSKGDLMLPSATAQWPTPAARDYRSESGGAVL